MKIRLIALTITLFAGFIVLAQPAAASSHCSISISPSSGAAVGESITVSGSGWDAGDTVHVNLSGIQLFTDGVTADGSGSFSANTTVPDLANGDHLVFAFNDSATCEFNGSFPVVDPSPPLVCTISGSPSGGTQAGATINLTGNGWAENDTVHINLGGVQLGSFSANAQGDLSASATVPDLALGDHQLFAFNDSATCEDNSTFSVIAATTTTTAAPTTTTASPTTTAAPTTTASANDTTTAAASSDAAVTTTSTTKARATTTTEPDQALDATSTGSSSSGTSTGILIFIILALLGAIGLGGSILWSRRG